VSERRACRVIVQPRSTQRYKFIQNDFDDFIRKRTIEIAREYGRYGYERVTEMIKSEGYIVNKKRIELIWRQEGLKVPHKQPKRARLWLADGSTIRHRPEYKNHVWSYDFVSDQTYDGRKIKVLNIIDEYSRELLISFTARRIRSQDVIFILADLFLKQGMPQFIRSDNGPEFVAKELMKWFKSLDVKPLFIQPGSPWENGYIESLNGRMRDEFLNGEIFYTLTEAKVLIERWRYNYNTKRLHSSLGYKPPAPETLQPKLIELVM
jgi:putative transposase